MACDRFRLRLVDDAAPQQVAVVRGQRVDLAAVGVEREREVLAVLDPEVAVEAALEVGRLALEPVGERRVLPDLAGEARAADLRVVGVALQLAGRPGEPRQPAVAVGDRVPGVLPALVLEARLLVAAPVGDVAVAHEGRRTRRSSRAPPVPRARARGRACGRRSSARTRRGGRRTAASRRRSRSRANAGAPRTPSSPRSASRAGSGPDPRRGSRPDAFPGAPELAQRRRGELGRERQRLQAREDAVAPEDGHEPGQPGCRQAAPPGVSGEKRSAARSTRLRVVRRRQRLPVALQPGAASIHCPDRAAARRRAPRVRRRVAFPLRARHAHGDVELGRSIRRAARSGRRTSSPCRRTVPASSPRRSSRGGTSRAGTRAEPPVLDPRRVRALLLQRVLDLEQVGEVAAGLEPDGEVDRLVVVVQDRQLLVEAVADGARRITESLGST